MVARLPARMRIALLTTDNREDRKDYGAPVPYFGAAPEALLQGFARTPEVEVHVVSCAQVPMRSPAKLAPNIFFHGLYVPRLGWLGSAYLGCIRAVRRKLREIQPDVVHGQGTERDCALCAVFSGLPNVVTIHGNMGALARQFRELGSYGRLAAMFEKVALRRTGGVFCNSGYTEQLVKPRARRTWRVANAVREEFFAPAGSADRPAGGGARRCTLVNVGAVCSPKRQVELLEVVRGLRQQGLEFECQFVGEVRAGASYGEAFLEKIKPLEKQGVARFLGPQSVSQLRAVYDRADGMVHFSAAESFSLVVAEGLARDLKLFAARVGGVPEVAAGVPEAELFDMDDWRGVTAAVAGWVRHGFPRARGAGELMRARYHPEVIARRHMEIYREVLRR
jgi:glycosyltransferase involved in cell wall biosynthesis